MIEQRASKESEPGVSPEIRRLEQELSELLDTRDAALSHTHESLRGDLNESYDLRAEELRTAVTELVAEAEARRPELQLVTAGVAWRDDGRLVIAPIGILEGVVVDAAVAAVRACFGTDCGPKVTTLPGLATTLVEAALPPTGAVSTELIAERMTDILRDVEEWPPEAWIGLVDLGEAGPLSAAEA
jgi:hypothetical protein